MNTRPMLSRQRDYLGYENHRNTVHAQLYTDIVNEAFGHEDVIVGHHITFERHGDIKTENEIPSADTLLFDVDVASRLFGEHFARSLLMRLALTPVESRDKAYADEFYRAYPHRKSAA